MFLFVSSGNAFPLTNREENVRYWHLQSIAIAAIKHNLRETDALMYVHSVLPGDLDSLLCI